MELAEIIAKLEAATEPDRALDEAIEVAVHPMLATLPRTEIGGWMHPAHGMVAPPQHYTASLDAALLLVPKKCGWTVHSSHPNHKWADSDSPCAKVYKGSAHRPWSFGATHAIAVCIAALEAQCDLAG